MLSRKCTSGALEGESISPDEAGELVQRHLRAPYAYDALREKLEAAARKAIADYIKRNSEEFSNLEFAEKRIEIALGDGVTVAGRIDLVRRIDSDEVTIVDLKSTERAQAEDVTETQLHIYALGYQELTGRAADYVEIYELDTQKPKTRSVDEDFHLRRQASREQRRGRVAPECVGATSSPELLRRLRLPEAVFGGPSVNAA